jgi:hypothetical protein
MAEPRLTAQRAVPSMWCDYSQFPNHRILAQLQSRATAWENAMKALILYVVFVIIGGLLSVAIGYMVEMEISSTASLIVFLALFFVNFLASWIAVILVMDGSLKDAQGRQAQLDIERAGRGRLAEHGGYVG